jgi:MFS family permease
LIAAGAGWRAAFLVPAIACAIVGVAYWRMTGEAGDRAADRARTAEVPMAYSIALAMFITFAVVSFSAGLIFNTITVAIPKIVDERFAQDIPLVFIGSVATMVLLFGGIAQLTVGRLVSKYPPHLLFVAIGAIQLLGVTWSVYADGIALLVALAMAIAGIYAQVTVADIVIARYTADAWRGRVYSVRFFLTFISSGAAIGIIAALHGYGGFFLVLAVTAGCAAVFLAAVLIVAMLANRAESDFRRVQPAE